MEQAAPPSPDCPFPPHALPLPAVAAVTAASLPEQYTLPHAKAIDLIGEEFVVRSLKTEPSESTSASTPSLTATATPRPSVVMSVSSAAAAAQVAESATAVAREVVDQSNLVYCNLNDLDFAAGPEGGVYTMGPGGGLTGLQEMVITSSSSGLLQMVQSVPCFQAAGQLGQEKASPYSAVSTILLQGGILQVRILYCSALKDLQPITFILGALVTVLCIANFSPV
jgi:hypothetical protein